MGTEVIVTTEDENTEPSTEVEPVSQTVVVDGGGDAVMAHVLEVLESHGMRISGLEERPWPVDVSTVVAIAEEVVDAKVEPEPVTPEPEPEPESTPREDSAPKSKQHWFFKGFGK